MNSEQAEAVHVQSCALSTSKYELCVSNVYGLIVNPSKLSVRICSEGQQDFSFCVSPEWLVDTHGQDIVVLML